ncbi:peptidoglycan editing factor PgeF [Pseudoxanthomonas sp.]|uniref:peptidoglycan editing factor PgeF n=1 Tax=Pseudoxanthomonas sp. TaxID=1871049 RepID=UPI00260B7DB2|nr:peptidoglycan editing factor PgeF [Pseudoxanthomonas sp.]WDS37614.1 MAG: peptidoglycan editing factor PgeF [Pseudoxanthomonas sp.]
MRPRTRVSEPALVSALLPADWPAPPGVQAFTTLRFGAGGSQAPFDQFNLGNRSAANGDVPAQVEANRAALVALAGLPSLPHWLRQVHGTGVERFDALLGQPRSLADEPQADASRTSEANVVLAILTADCLPVVFAAADGSEVAAAHAGWRGLADGVLEATVAAMDTPAARLRAWLGPAAGPQAYEIGQEVFDAFTVADPGATAAFTATRPGHWRVDLYALARRRLAAVGVDDVHGGGLCTISDPQRFYSHRRDARTGRLATLVWRSA